MSVYQYLRKLQQIPDAYDRWRDYRAALTNYVLSSTDMDSSLAIFGAGACNDIDLGLLISHFSSITLIDSDAHAMQLALSRYGLCEYNRIHCEVIDLVGITDHAYEEFATTLTSQLQLFGRSIDLELLESVAVSYLHQLYEHIRDGRLHLGAARYDYSVAFGLHSQLNNMPVWIYDAIIASLTDSSCNAPADSHTRAVAQLVSEETPAIIHKVNDTILSCTKKAVLFSNELESTASNGPISGAMECILDIKDRYSSCEKAVITWPFDTAHNRSYKMLLQKVLL